MGRNQQGSRNSSAGRGRGKGGGKKKTSTGKPDEKKKTMSDYIYHPGSVRSAAEYVKITKYLINHIRITFDEGEVIGDALRDRKEKDFAPDKPVLQKHGLTKAQGQSDDDFKEDVENAKQANLATFKYLMSDHQRQIRVYKSNKPKAAALLSRQCSKDMQSKLQERENWPILEKDPILLLNAIQEHSLNYTETKHPVITVFEALKSLLNIKQKDDESLTDYTKRHKAAMDVFLSHAGASFIFPKLILDYPNYATDSDDEADAYKKLKLDERGS